MKNGDKDDNDVFFEHMQDVVPLTIEKKIPISRQSLSPLTVQARRAAAIASVVNNSNYLNASEVVLLDPYYPLEFRRPGVQLGVFKKLKQGKYAADARLDLHRMTAEQACKEVFDFIQVAIQYDLRTVIIVHGKGNHGDGESALLKSHVNKWLPQMSEVQAYSSAQPRHGGLGAVYVLLSKSERKKNENRERLSRGRTIS